MRMTWKMKNRVFLILIICQLVLLANAQAIELLGREAQPVIPRECAKYSCWCISTQGESHGGFGINSTNLGIRIVKIDPRVTRITISYSATGAPFYSRLPRVGETIPLTGTAYTRAYANKVGLGCAVHFWTIDKKGNPIWPRR